MPEMDEAMDDVDVDTTDTQSDSDAITYEQAMEWKQKAERLEKAEKKLVELKKSAKESKPADDVYTKQDALVDRFILKNPDLEGHEESLKEYLKKGIELEDARILVENKDKTIKNRQKAEEMSVTSSEATPKSTYSKSDLENMSQDDYNRAMDAIEKGKATLR
jgi:hypothetical protein